MRRLGAEEWAGLVTFVVSVAVAGPVLIGIAEVHIPRGGWVGMFLVMVGALLIAATGERPGWLRYVAFAVGVLASWGLVLTAPDAGLLPIFMVVTAALSVYIAPLPVGLLLVGCNTVVLTVVVTSQAGTIAPTVLGVGFYLLIQLATLLTSFTLIREQRTRRELTEAHVELRAASVLLSESARTTERLRISRELHDLIGHQLTVLTLELEAARHRENEQAREHVERANTVARDLLGDVRATVGELRSESVDLTETLQGVTRDLPGLDVSVDVAPDVRADEPRTAVLVRAVQEIVTNAIRHAEASTLRIRISHHDDGTVLSAVDDGRGATEPALGNGLRGLVERFEELGGHVSLDGSDGFRVTARVPAP